MVANCKVKCISTGKVFNSIKAASKEANANMWTMSIKMENAGKFIDSNGKEYIRLEAMKCRKNNPKKYGCFKSHVKKLKKDTPLMDNIYKDFSIENQEDVDFYNETVKPNLPAKKEFDKASIIADAVVYLLNKKEFELAQKLLSII